MSSSQWLVKLEGEAFDVDEYHYWFRSGPVYAVKQNGAVYLRGDAFAGLSDPHLVAATADTVVTRMFAVLTLLQPNLRRPTVASVVQVDGSGAQRGVVLLAAAAEVRMKARATLSTGGTLDDDGEP